MILLPAMDLLDRKVVKLDAAHRAAEKIYGTPSEIADRWIGEGAEWLHLVDLDGAFDQGSNDVPILQVIPRCREKRVHVQVGGGIRDERRLRLFMEGRYAADRIVVGTRAVTDETWLARASGLYPHRLMVAVDAKGLEVMVEGWQKSAGMDVLDFIRRASQHPIAGFLYTNVSVEGKGQGVDWRPVERIAAESPKPVVFSGGVSSIDEVRRFKDLRAYGIIVGSALYAGRFTLEEARRAAE